MQLRRTNKHLHEVCTRPDFWIHRFLKDHPDMTFNEQQALRLSPQPEKLYVALKYDRYLHSHGLEDDDIESSLILSTIFHGLYVPGHPEGALFLHHFIARGSIMVKRAVFVRRLLNLPYLHDELFFVTANRFVKEPEDVYDSLEAIAFFNTKRADFLYDKLLTFSVSQGELRVVLMDILRRYQMGPLPVWSWTRDHLHQMGFNDDQIAGFLFEEERHMFYVNAALNAGLF